MTGTIVGDDLYYVARSQLRAFDGPTIWPADRLKETVILQLPLETPAPPAVDLQKEKEALLALHQRGIRAHVERDASALADGVGAEMIMTTNGKIERATSRPMPKLVAHTGFEHFAP